MQRTTAAQLHAQQETEQALEDAKTDAATAALLREPDPVDDLTSDETEDETVDVDLAAELEGEEAPPPDLPAPTGSAIMAPPAPAPQVSVFRHRGKEYVRDPKRPLHTCGYVCTTNWVGNVNGQRVVVKYGAPLSTIPMNVRKALAESNIRFAIAKPPERRGATLVDEPDGPPRARRRPRNMHEDELADSPRVRSRFRPIAHLPTK